MTDYTITTNENDEVFTKTLAEAKKIAREFGEAREPIIDKSVNYELTEWSWYLKDGKFTKR